MTVYIVPGGQPLSGKVWYPFLGKWGTPGAGTHLNPWTEWMTKEGILLQISDMSDRHLYHSMRLVARKYDAPPAGLLQEWRRRGKPEDGWKRDDFLTRGVL